MSIDQAWLQAKFPELTQVSSLASGGQKWVFTAVDPNHGEIVLKVVAPKQDAERIRREVLAVGMIGSNRVPVIHDTGTVTSSVGDLLWIKEQRIHGETLRSRIARGPLGGAELRKLALDVLEALADAEAQRVVHRDVKPENIIADTTGNYWLIDFGIARHLDLSSVTTNAAAFGPATIGYAPPEQLRNRKRDIDARADLFALGVMLHECATGTHPLATGARDRQEIIRRTESTPISALRLPWDTGGTFAGFVSALTQRRAEHRPRTVAEALEWCRRLP